MAGTGNLILKKKVGSTAANDGGIPNDSTLPEGMPALQLVGLPPVIEIEDSSAFLYPGHPLANVTNRLWIGMNTSAWTSAGGASGSGWAGGYNPNPQQFYGPAITAQSPSRPIWMGAEIRAWTPLVKGGANPTGSDSLTYTVLKASWDPDTNLYLNTYDPVSSGRVTALDKIYASDEVLVTQRAIWYYVEGRIQQITFGFNSNFATKEGAALLGEDGATKGPQTFLSPIAIEQKLTLNGYTQNDVSYPATIYSDNAEASIFDENVSDLTIGASCANITIGDSSTEGTTTTSIYGNMVLSGDFSAVLDGGSF